MGCILRDFDYQEPANVPPSVLGSADDPLDTVQRLDLDAPVGGDAGASSDVEIVAIVRDPNVREPLLGLVFVDRNRGVTRPIGPEFPIPPEQDEDPLHRRVPFRVPRAAFPGPGCHSVELHVSGGFIDFSNPRPAIEGDLGVGVWWFAVVDATQPAPDMTECATMEAL